MCKSNFKPWAKAEWGKLEEIHRKSLQNQISPRYEEDEIEVRAYIRTYIQIKKRVNFDNDFESAFVMGWKLGKDKNKYRDAIVRIAEGPTLPIDESVATPKKMLEYALRWSQQEAKRTLGKL